MAYTRKRKAPSRGKNKRNTGARRAPVRATRSRARSRTSPTTLRIVVEQSSGNNPADTLAAMTGMQPTTPKKARF